MTRQSKHKERRSTKESEKNNEKKKQKKEKIQIPRGHKLLTKETYPHLQKTMWTNIDNVLTTYQQKFLKDIDSIEQRKGLIDHYFLFIFIQMLIQSKIIFDSKRPQSNPFFQEVIADCLDHIQKKYKIILSISPENIKKKIFTTIDENTQPLECIYKNAIDEDLVHWENYFNTYFFEFKETSVDHIRRQIMEKRKENSQNMDKSWELLNPAYHIAKEKKEKIQTTIAILQKHEAEDNLIGKVLHQLQETLKQTEDDIKRHVVFEEDPIASKELESLVKIQQQYLKRYQVPVQYRKIFGLVINRLNNFYQIKTNLYKKAQKNNNEAFDRLIHSEQTSKDILYHINTLITKQQINSFFDEKWTKKQEEKTQRIQSFCIGTNKIIPPPKQSR